MPITQIVAMAMTIAMNCRMIRIRIRFCERVGLPPRIIFVRPISNTAVTEASEIGTRTWLRIVIMGGWISPADISSNCVGGDQFLGR